MADIVASLFGVTPESYQQQQNARADERALAMAQLTPFQRAEFNINRGAYGLGQAIGGIMGAQDPQLRLISARNSIARQINYSDPASIMQGVQQLSQAGDTVGAMQLADVARKLESQQALTTERKTAAALNVAQTAKALRPDTPKLTGDERYVSVLQEAERLAREGQNVPPELLSQANIAAQLLAKPRTYFDQASGQTVTVPATDPSRAFPNIFKQFGALPVAPAAEGAAPAQPTAPLRPTAPTPGAATTTQVTAGNLPAGSQKRLGEIDAALSKLETSGPELNTFLDLIKTGKVKYDATSNVLDFVGAVVPPAFGLQERGNQVDKDRIDRALTERVNTLLLMAKGTQTEGDATRAQAQIASYTARFSPERMKGAIESLIRAEEKLKKELAAEQTTLRGQGRAPAAAQPRPAAAPAQMSDEDKIKRFIEYNGGKPTRDEAVRVLRSRGVIKGE